MPLTHSGTATAMYIDIFETSRVTPHLRYLLTRITCTICKPIYTVYIERRSNIASIDVYAKQRVTAHRKKPMQHYFIQTKKLKEIVKLQWNCWEKRACPKRNVSANLVFSDLLQMQLHFSHVHPVCVCNISFFVCLQQLYVRMCVYVLLLCLPRTQRRRRCSCSCCYCCVFFLLFFIGSCSGKEKGCVPAVKTVKITNQTKLLLQPHPFCVYIFV